MVKFLKRFWQNQDTLERKLFWSILVVVTIVASFSAAFTIAEEISFAASLCSVGCALTCIAVAFIAVRTSLYNQCYLVMCCVLSCFLLPLLFLFCGGVTSGMPLYCITSLALISFAMRGRAKLIAFLISIGIQVIVATLAWARPELVIAELDRDSSYLDFIVTMVLTGITLFVVGSVSLYAYNHERENSAKLVARLDYLSMRDPLTGLYNRRHVLSYLGSSVWLRRNDFYLAMLDLDRFKGINSIYGNDVGDEIICAIGKMLQRYEDESSGECVARFGCEKFIYIINASSEVEAYAKVESFRKAVMQCQFEKYPQISVTVSGGFLPCGLRSLRDVKQLLTKVDELLVAAKNEGRNQIRNMIDN